MVAGMCCEKHDRLDLKLSSLEFLDAPCGTPTLPDGERRFCCRGCPAQGQPVTLKAVWASNPLLMAFLTDADQREVMRLAIALGPLQVDILTVLPEPAPAGTTAAVSP